MLLHSSPYLRNILVALLSLLEIHHVPNRIEILQSISQVAFVIESTHVGLDILVLEVERMLPDINTNDRQVGEERILVCSRRNLQLLGRRVDTLIAHANMRTNTDEAQVRVGHHGSE